MGFGFSFFIIQKGGVWVFFLKKEEKKKDFFFLFIYISSPVLCFFEKKKRKGGAPPGQAKGVLLIFMGGEYLLPARAVLVKARLPSSWSSGATAWWQMI